jgi:hypothetical protein
MEKDIYLDGILYYIFEQWEFFKKVILLKEKNKICPQDESVLFCIPLISYEISIIVP